MKSHNYHASFDALCSKCRRPEIDHGSLAQCEACSFSGECEIFPATGMLLCPDCTAREQATPSNTAPVDKNRSRVSYLLNQLDKGIAMDARGLFVSRIDSIASVEQKLRDAGAPESQVDSESIAVVSELLDKIQERLVAINKEAFELRTYAEADRRYLTMRVPSLREEEREKYKKYDITYRPSPAIPAIHNVKAAVARKSQSDKALESQANSLGISVERMQAINAANLAKILGKPCTCASTPGICVLHPKL